MRLQGWSIPTSEGLTRCSEQRIATLLPGSSFNTFQIDNHYARYLLLSRTKDLSYDDYFRAFLDAHNLLIKQARTEKDSYYPFKVARSYSDFVVQNIDRLAPEQKEVISKSVAQMIKQIDGSSAHVLRYPMVEEARGDLFKADRLLKETS